MTEFRYKPNPNWTMYFEARTSDIDDPKEIATQKGLWKRAYFTLHVGWERENSLPERDIGQFVLEPMPGCCGVVVSTGSFLHPKERGVFSQYFHDMKAFVARELGYSRMLATTETSNFPEIIGAAKNGWKLHEAFTNKRTGHQLTVMEKAL
jgi:hypothetical protein